MDDTMAKARLTRVNRRAIIPVRARGGGVHTLRGGAEAARRAHNPKVPGSNPGPAI